MKTRQLKNREFGKKELEERIRQIYEAFCKLPTKQRTEYLADLKESIKTEINSKSGKKILWQIYNLLKSEM